MKLIVMSLTILLSMIFVPTPDIRSLFDVFISDIDLCIGFLYLLAVCHAILFVQLKILIISVVCFAEYARSA